MSDGSVWPSRLGRLAAIFSALVASGACSSEQRAARDGAWEFQVDTARSDTAANAGPAAWLRGTGVEGPQGKPQTTAAILSFDCRPDHTGATILTAQALRQGTADVTLALDEDRARPIDAFAGTTATGGQVVLTPPLDSVLGLVRGRQRITIEYADGAGSSKTTAVFDLAGLETFRERFLAACGGGRTRGR